MSSAQFDYAPLLPAGLPAPAARWTGLAKYSFVGGNNDPDGVPVDGLVELIGYIVQGQGPGGGWMYSYDKTADDLSVSGWQIQALKAAHLSQLKISGVDQALDKAMSYIERVKGPKGGYGYRGPEDQIQPHRRRHPLPALLERRPRRASQRHGVAARRNRKEASP